MFFIIKMIGIIPAKTIIIEAPDASIINSSDASSNALTDKVLKLKGLKTEVSGSSFIISTKTIKKLVSKGVPSKGICKDFNIFLSLIPISLAVSSIL